MLPAWPLMTQWAPPIPVSQKSYWTMGSPSASVAVNRVVAATVWSWLMFDALWVELATGANTTDTAGDQAPKWMPSVARSQMVSGPVPAL
jgi:hypothetical protein